MSAISKLRVSCMSVCAAGAVALLAAASSTGAQPNASKGPPNAMQGFSQNRDKPIQIESSSLEVRDKDKVATFSGNVRVVQGDTTMRCKSLVVFYDGQAAPGASRTATAGTPGQPPQQISRLEAKGGVVVTQKDQTATGDSALFDVRNNTVTLMGNVVVSQGQNVMRGDRLVVDLTSGVSRVDAGKSHGPVRMLIQQTPSQPGATPPNSSTPRLGPTRPFGSN